MKLKNIHNIVVGFIVFLLVVNIQAKGKDTNEVKILLSEDLTNEGYTLIDSAVKNTFDQYGYLHIYVQFITNKELPDILINFFDKEDHVFSQCRNCDKVLLKNINNISFFNSCYSGSIDILLIKTIVIEKQ